MKLQRIGAIAAICGSALALANPALAVPKDWEYMGENERGTKMWISKDGRSFEGYPEYWYKDSVQTARGDSPSLYQVDCDRIRERWVSVKTGVADDDWSEYAGHPSSMGYKIIKKVCN